MSLFINCLSFLQPSLNPFLRLDLHLSRTLMTRQVDRTPGSHRSCPGNARLLSAVMLLFHLRMYCYQFSIFLSLTKLTAFKESTEV